MRTSSPTPAVPHPALLLLGPTGSGKTPLGDFLEGNSLLGRRCVHFDFGAQLRRIAADAAAAGRPVRPAALTEEDVRVIRHSLATGTLLERRHFPIAMKLLDAFAAERRIRREDLLVLNGLPRHPDQAAALERRADLRFVLHLRCPGEVIRERIRADTGGDRAGRVDDSPEFIAHKCRLFEERSLPLLDYYRRRGVPILAVDVEARTQPADIVRTLSSLLPRIPDAAHT